MTPSPLSDYICVTDAAAALGVSRQAVLSLCARGHMPGAVVFAGRWLVPRAAIAARKSAKKAGRLPKNQHKSRPCNRLRNSQKSG